MYDHPNVISVILGVARSVVVGNIGRRSVSGSPLALSAGSAGYCPLPQGDWPAAGPMHVASLCFSAS